MNKGPKLSLLLNKKHWRLSFCLLLYIYISLINKSTNYEFSSFEIKNVQIFPTWKIGYWPFLPHLSRNSPFFAFPLFSFSISLSRSFLCHYLTLFTLTISLFSLTLLFSPPLSLSFPLICSVSLSPSFPPRRGTIHI